MTAWAAPEYRFYIAGARTGTTVAEFSMVNDMNLNLMLNRPGAASFVIPQREASLKFKNGWRTMYPGSHALYIERDGQIIFGGVIDSVSTKNAEAGLNVTAKGWWEHFRTRLLRQRRLYSNRDVYDIIRTTWTVIDSQSQLRGPDLNMVFPVDEDRGVNRTVTYEAWELNSFASIVEAWANASDTEFDFAVNPTRRSGGFGLNLMFWHPERGTEIDTVLTFERASSSPDNIADFEFNVTLSNQATQLYGIGAGDSWTKKISRQQAAWVPTEGNPNNPGSGYTFPDEKLDYREFAQRDGVYSRSDIYVQAHLDSVTADRLKYVGTPPIAFGLTLSRDFEVDTQLLVPGNYATVHIEDGYVDVNELQRITGVNLKLGDDMTEVVTLQTTRPTIEA